MSTDTGNRPEGHDQFTVADMANQNAKFFDARAAAEDALDRAEDAPDVEPELFGPGESPEWMYGDDAEVVEAEPVDTPDPEPPTDAPDALGGMVSVGIDRDPLNVLPGWMITEVSYSGRGDTSTTVNKRGCQVIAEHLGLAVETEALTPAEETGFAHAYYRAEATTPNGRTFTAHAAARADGEDQDEDDGWKLDMQAETRAYKRAVKAATGGGLAAFGKGEEASHGE